MGNDEKWWTRVSEEIPLKTERQKCIPDSGVPCQTRPHVPSPKPRKQRAHIETHFTAGIR